MGNDKGFEKGYFVATLIDQNTRCRDGGIFVDETFLRKI